MTVKYSIVLRQRIGPAAAGVSLAEIADRCNIHPHLVDRLVQLGLVDPAGRDESGREWIFQQDAVALVQKIVRLRNELGINYTGIGVVLELLSRIEQLEARIRDMDKRL